MHYHYFHVISWNFPRSVVECISWINQSKQTHRSILLTLSMLYFPLINPSHINNCWLHSTAPSYIYRECVFSHMNCSNPYIETYTKWQSPRWQTITKIVRKCHGFISKSPRLGFNNLSKSPGLTSGDVGMGFNIWLTLGHHNSTLSTSKSFKENLRFCLPQNLQILNQSLTWKWTTYEITKRQFNAHHITTFLKILSLTIYSRYTEILVWNDSTKLVACLQ